MKIKNARKLGFFGALTMLLGSIVGIGIFLKNGSVFRAVDYNGTAALIAWIVAGLLALFAAISFTEIGSMKTKNVHGLAAWAERLGGKKYGYFVRTSFSIFYYAFFTATLGAFTSETFFQFLKEAGAVSEQPPIWAHALIGIALSISVIAMNRFSVKASGYFAIATTILKFVPLIIAFIVGFAFAGHHFSPAPGGSNIISNGSISFTGILSALPAVLFAYDAFIGVGSLSEKTHGGPKTVSKIVIIGMISVIVLYSLVTITSIMHVTNQYDAQGNIVQGAAVADLIKDSMKDSKLMNTFLHFFIFASAYGVLNGMTSGYVSTFEQGYETNTFFGSKTFKAKFGDRKGWVYLITVYTGIVMILALLPAVIMNSDVYIDAVTNFPTLIFFVVYASVIFLYLKNGHKVETRKINKVLFKVSAWIAIIGIFFIVAYQLFYGFTIQAFITPDGPSHAGLFADHGKSLTSIGLFGVFVMMMTLFIGIPFLNRFLVKKFEKHDPIIDTQNNSFADLPEQA